MAEEKKLEVKDLRISFTTANGKVQAVRDISFDLYKGETLAIVGESGSGKSVTSRAIMGILAGNAIKEGGKILYGDKDLMKTPEDEFHRIRGDKIAMVFQDPLSSLNPIMRVGQQLTEAMLLKNKTSRRESKVAMNRLFKALDENMTAAGVTDAKADLEKFKKFGIRHSKLESEYTAALDYAKQAQAEAESIILHIENKAVDKLGQDITDFCQAAKKSISHFVVRDRA
ncbi:MAG: ABC transporter ATP-binding protein, partial [Oscillospiraceae bacterium]|nr:ABC transporter ATP-binding protein [Oscillospiraceae bacterium]